MEKEGIDESEEYKHPQQQQTAKELQQKIRRFRYNLILKMLIPIALAICIVGFFTTFAIFYFIDHLKVLVQQTQLDYEHLGQNTLNYLQAKTIQNQIQMTVTSLHQLYSINSEIVAGSTTPTHQYPTNYVTTFYTTPNAGGTLPVFCHCQVATCSYDATPITVLNTPVASVYVPPWYEIPISFITSTTVLSSDYYVFFAKPFGTLALDSNTRVLVQFDYQRFYRIARPIYKSLVNYIDYISILQQDSYEFVYPQKAYNTPTDFTCTYDFTHDSIYQKTNLYTTANSKDLVQTIFIDETESSTDRKIKSTFCLTLAATSQCTLATTIPCGQICIQTAREQALVKKLLSRNSAIDGSDYLLVSSQQNSNYELFNKPNYDSTGKMISFQNFYEYAFGTQTAAVMSSYIETHFKSIFGYNLYPYDLTKKTTARYYDENQGFGVYQRFSAQTDTIFSYSYVTVNQDYEDTTTDKILYTLFTQSSADVVLAQFLSIIDKSESLKRNWIGVSIAVSASILCCVYLVHIIMSPVASSVVVLTSKIQDIQTGNLSINLLVNFQSIYSELNELYNELEQINLQVKYSSDMFYNTSDDENLVNYTNAISIFQHLKNSKITGIILNNLGNIHARNQRYKEAITCFRKAQKLVEKELRKLIHFDYPQVFYQAKPTCGWKSFKDQMPPPSPIGWLDPEDKIIKADNQNTNIRVNAKKKKKLEEIYCNRLFALANALIELGNTETRSKEKLLIFEEAIDTLLLVVAIDKNLDYARSRSIKIYFKLSYAFINKAKLTSVQEDWFEGFDSLDTAANKFSYYQTVHNLFRDKQAELRNKQRIEEERGQSVNSRSINNMTTNLESSRNNYTNIELAQTFTSRKDEFESPNWKDSLRLPRRRQLNDSEIQLEIPIDDPPEILNSELLMTNGSVHYDFGRLDKALVYCTDSIEQGKKFNPEIRRQCLMIIMAIFEKQITKKQERLDALQKDSMEYQQMEVQLKSFVSSLVLVKQMLVDNDFKGQKKQKDIVFLIDYSESMGKYNTKVADVILNIYQMYLKDMDRLAMVKFNHNIDVVFELQTRGKNDIFVEKFVSDIRQIQCKGDKALYNAIHEGIKLFNKAEPTTNSRWIVTLTDDQDNYSRIDEEKLSKFFKDNRVKFIVIGLNLKQSASLIYQKMCLATGGTFINSPNSESLKVAFQAITNLKDATDQQSNYIDEKFD